MNTAAAKPLKFFAATAVKDVYMARGRVAFGTRMYVAKWNGLYVVALNEKEYFIFTAEQAMGYVKTERNQFGKPVVAFYKAPKIMGTEEPFTWKVMAGHTCPDGCCGDDCPTFQETVSGKEAALALEAKLEKGEFKGPLCWVRVIGPAYHSYKWNPIPERA